jgi:hypothetical protein
LLLVAILVVSVGGQSTDSSAQTPVSLSGIVWRDDNANGVRDSGEPGIADAEVELTGPAEPGRLPESQTTHTDAAGQYSFTGQDPGSYQVTLGPTLSGMWVETYPTRHLLHPSAVDINLSSNSQADFGLYPAAGLPRFRGTAWRDAEPVPGPDVRPFVNGIDCTLPAILPPDQGINAFGFKVASAALIPGCGEEGDTIVFTIGGAPANEAAIWHLASVEQLPPGTVPSIPPPPAIAPPRDNTQGITLTIGPAFAAYSVRVQDAQTGQFLDVASPPRFPNIEAFIGETSCGSTSGIGLTAQVIVPSEQMKAGCGREGASVRFTVDGAEAPEQVAWVSGLHSLTLTYSSTEVPADVFRILIAALPLLTPLDRAATGFDTLGASLGTLTVLANGTTCTQVDVTAPEADIIIELGRPGPPEECSTDGATITFENSKAQELAIRMTLTKGTQQRLDNFAPVPPSSGEPPPSGTIKPPNTGDGGLTR